MYTFLLDADVRARMLRRVSDSGVRQFWAMQYDNLAPGEQSRRVQSLVNRLESLFLGRALVRNIVGQQRTSIDFRRVMEERQIIFVKLPVKTLTHDARLIGTILLAKLSAAIFSFADVPEAARPGVSLYVDEFQHFCTPDFSELFIEGRKFGARVTLAHQYRGQLPDFLQESTMTARTKVVFQTTPEDGHKLAHLFPVPAELRAEDIEPHVSAHLLTYGCDDPYVHTFIEQYLRPMLVHKHGRRVEIRDPGYGVMDFFFDLHSGGHGRASLFVDDPTPYLDSLLYDVMRRRDPNLVIPEKATFGFGNCGRGFYKATRHADPEVLTARVSYPLNLLLVTADVKYIWTRPPQDASEQLYHFIFHLRMTMRYLAANPIGEPTAVSSTEVGRMLTQLPRRAAFVRSGEVASVIYTHDTPDGVMGTELDARMTTIRDHTREHYGHPRAEVERLLSEAAKPEEDIVLDVEQGAAADARLDGDMNTGEPVTDSVTSRWEGI